MKHHLFGSTLVLTVALAGAAGAQEGPLTGILSGRSVQLTVKLKSLDQSWRRIRVTGPFESNGGGISQMMGGLMGAMFGGGAAAPPAATGGPVFYTQGNTLTAGTESFLIAYKAQLKGLDLGKLAAAQGPGGLPEPDKLTAETDLTLSLLNLRSVAGIGEIKPFNLQQEVADSARAAEEESKLRASIGQGMAGGAGPAVTDVLTRPVPTPGKPAPKKPAPRKR